MTWKPRLRTILLTVNLIVFLLPIISFGSLRIYQSELIRRTEAELISQGAMIQAAYKQEVLRRLKDSGDSDLRTYGTAAGVKWPMEVEEWLKPVPASLDLSEESVAGPAAPPRRVEQSPDTIAAAAGQAIMPIVKDAQQITLSGLQVVDFNGIVVAATGMFPGVSLAHREEVSRALNGEFIQMLRRRESDEPDPPLDSISRRTDVRVFVTMPIVHEGRLLGAVVLSRTPMSLMKAIYKHRFLFGGSLALMLLGVISISVLTSYFIGQPIRALIAQTDRIIEGGEDAGEPIEDSGTREFDQLSTAVADMAQTIEKRAEYIRTFAQNVSHEFKTPLSSIRGTVELLQDHWESMDDAKRERFLGMLEADGERLQRLVERLLDLARADVLDPGDSATELCPVLDRTAEQYHGESLAVQTRCGEEIGEVVVSEEVLESVLSNLLENARQHGATEVTLEATTISEDIINLDVRDDGPGISEGNADKIFDAFFTTARDEGGTGLGLSIVQSLLEAHDGSIELLDCDEGTAFRVCLLRS